MVSKPKGGKFVTVIKEKVFFILGKFQGCYNKVSAHVLGATVIKEVIRRANVDPNDICEVIMGQALPAGEGQNPARQASLKAGISIETPAYGINMLCGSGLKAVGLGFQAIRNGDSCIVIAGGQENMTKSPHTIHLRSEKRMGNATIVDSMLCDGLTDAMNKIHMGETAEILAKEYQIGRQEQDVLAAKSHSLADAAQKAGYFDEETVQIDATVINKDENVRPGTNVESLGAMKPIFVKENGTITVGNASGINDSAACVLLASAEAVAEGKLKPLAKIVAFAQTGCDPKTMGAGPITAVPAVLKKAGWTMDQVDLFELNEAFAAQALAVNKGLGLDGSNVNINGGAIALGHPIGASGARILVTLIYALKRTQKKRGVASLCVGGGMGVAMAIEMLE